VLNLIKKSVANTKIKNVCITGGYGLNVIANQYYLESLPEVNFYFEPLADDSGNSLGGAMYQYRYYTRDMKVYPIKDTFFHGKKYNINKIKGEKCTYESIANKLSTGESVAIYEGYAEAGPRALGNRSILFDARNPDAKNLINRVKNREWYRPFAAAVLEEDASLYFDMIIPTSPYMTVSFNANQYAIENIPGVIHVDGTCRIQTVSKENKNLYNLLKEFKKATGHGVLLNTSFNLAGEPLVETPEEALSVLDRSELSLVWFPEISKYVGK
jgi:carbamoyltransferase